MRNSLLGAGLSVSDVTEIDRLGYVHEALLYRSEQELLDAVVPFVEDGRRDDEATVVTFGPPIDRLVRDALGHVDGVLFDLHDDTYATPAATIKTHLRLHKSLLGAGAERIRIVGEVPAPGSGAPWHAWARYEAAVNEAYRDLPVWGLCCYDARNIDPDVLRDVQCTHARIATPDGEHQRNPQYRDPRTWLSERPAPAPDPLETTIPLVELRDPWPHEARDAVEPVAGHLPPAITDDLVTAVSEVVANARMHGGGPVLTRVWAERDRVVVTVDDTGTGPDDPFVGLLPPRRVIGEGGLGLWIAHQMCDDVSLSRTADGFRVRIVARRPVSA